MNLVHTIPDDTPRPVIGQRARDGERRIVLTSCTYACRLHSPSNPSLHSWIIGSVLTLFVLMWSVNKHGGYERGQIVALAITLSVAVAWFTFAVRPRSIPATVPLLEHVITVVPEELAPQARELAHRAERFHRANQWASEHQEHSVPNGHDELRHAANALSSVVTAKHGDRDTALKHLAQAFKGLDLV